MRIRLDFSGGVRRLFDDNDNGLEPPHAIFSTPFIKKIIDTRSQKRETEQVNVPLPSFIYGSSIVFDEFLDVLSVLAEGTTREMEFGKYSDLTYLQVYIHHRDYWEWGKRQRRPSDELEDFLDWVKAYRANCRSEFPELMIPIAKYFRIDTCSGCGMMGAPPTTIKTTSNKSPQITSSSRQQPKWPRFPDWETVTKHVEGRRKLTAWKKAWEQAHREKEASGKVVACGGRNETFCSDCLLQNCSQGRRQYHYKDDDCRLDLANWGTPEFYQAWNERSAAGSYGRGVYRNHSCGGCDLDSDSDDSDESSDSYDSDDSSDAADSCDSEGSYDSDDSDYDSVE